MVSSCFVLDLCSRADSWQPSRIRVAWHVIRARRTPVGRQTSRTDAGRRRSGAAAGAPDRTASGGSRASCARPSTTAGRAWPSSSPSRPMCTGRRPRASSPATTAPTSASTSRSIPIAAASTAASTATRGRPTAISATRPGLDFETKLYAKVNAAELLERELANPRYVPKVIALGAVTDPYQPIEREHRITRVAARGAGASRAIPSASSPSRPW